jgi:hypothetical protein
MNLRTWFLGWQQPGTNAVAKKTNEDPFEKKYSYKNAGKLHHK